MSLMMLQVTFLILVICSVLSSGMKFLSPGGVYYWTHSALTDVPDEIPDDVILVDLGHNNITKLKRNSFIELNSCTNLNLWFNSISHLDVGSFKGLRELKELFLSNNMLTELTTGVFIGLESLVSLHVSNNLIRTVQDGTFEGLSSLQELWVSNNRLTDLRFNTLNGLENVKVLKLWGNKIVTMETNAFRNLRNLSELWLSENLLKEINIETFSGLETLEALHLGWNELVTIETNAFSSLKNVRFLDLRSNHLTALQKETLHGLKQLETLILSNNDIVTMAPGIFSNHPRPMHLSLEGNPLRCDCALCWLKRDEQKGRIIWNETPQDGRPDCAKGDGRWTDLLCPVTECFDPGTVENGVSQGYAPFMCHSQVTFSCNEGFLMSGESLMTCAENGRWNVEKPKCIAKDNENLASVRIIVPVVVIVLAATIVMVIHCNRHRKKKTQKCNEHVVPCDYGQGRPWENVEWPGCSAKNLMRLSVAPPGWTAPFTAIDAQEEKKNGNCSDV